MTIKNIVFNRTTHFMGRNGAGKQKGVEICDDTDNCIVINPRTSTGIIGNCSLRFPNENIPDLIKALQAFLPEPVVEEFTVEGYSVNDILDLRETCDVELSNTEAKEILLQVSNRKEGPITNDLLYEYIENFVNARELKVAEGWT